LNQGIFLLNNELNNEFEIIDLKQAVWFLKARYASGNSNPAQSTQTEQVRYFK